MIEGYNKKNGELLQPNSFGTKSKILFAIFKKRDVNYSLTEDFKFLGGFGSYTATVWRNQNGRVSSYGSRPRNGRLPDNLNELILAKLEIELLLPTSEQKVNTDLPSFSEMIFNYLFGTRFMARGQKVRRVCYCVHLL